MLRLYIVVPLSSGLNNLSFIIDPPVNQNSRDRSFHGSSSLSETGCDPTITEQRQTRSHQAMVMAVDKDCRSGQA